MGGISGAIASGMIWSSAASDGGMCLVGLAVVGAITGGMVGYRYAGKADWGWRTRGADILLSLLFGAIVGAVTFPIFILVVGIIVSALT